MKSEPTGDDFAAVMGAIVIGCCVIILILVCYILWRML